MWEVSRVIRCETWEDLKKTAKKYANMGFRCEVRGWDDIRNNKLTILDDWGIEEDRSESEEQAKEGKNEGDN